MSTEAIVAVSRMRDLKPRSKLLLLVLAIRSDADDVCADGLQALCEMTGMSAASVNKHLYLLGDDGLVQPNFDGEHSAGILVDVESLRRHPGARAE